MATDEELIKLTLAIQGQAEAARLRGEMEKLRKQIADVGSSMSANDPKMLAMARQMDTLRNRVGDLDKQFGSAGSTRNWGRSILEGSRALEDLQYGVAGVLNNIPSLVQSLGGPAGLAGAASLVAVGATVLYRNWDTLTGLFGESAVKTVAEQMKELEAIIERTAKQTEKLNALKRDEQREKKTEGKAAELAEARPEAQETSAGLVHKAITKQGGANRTGFDVLADTLKKDNDFLDQFIDKAGKARIAAAGQKAWAGDLTSAAELARKQRNAIADERAKAEQEMRKALADPATFGNAASIKRLRGAVRDNEKNLKNDGFDTDKFLGDLEHASPEAVKQRQEEKEVFEGEKKMREGMIADRKAAQDEWNAGVERMKAGMERELSIRKEQQAQHEKVFQDAKHSHDKELAEQAAYREKMAKLREPIEQQMGRQVEKNKAASSGLMDRMANASGLYSPIDQMMMQARMVSASNPMRRPRVKRWDEMTAEEKRHTTRAENYAQVQASRMPMSMEEQEQEMARRNTANDDIIKARVAKQLLKNKVTRDPNYAAGMAEKMVNQERKAMNEMTGDQPVDRNTKEMERLREELAEINRKGVFARASK